MSWAILYIMNTKNMSEIYVVVDISILHHFLLTLICFIVKTPAYKVSTYCVKRMLLWMRMYTINKVFVQWENCWPSVVTLRFLTRSDLLPTRIVVRSVPRSMRNSCSSWTAVSKVSRCAMEKITRKASARMSSKLP